MLWQEAFQQAVEGGCNYVRNADNPREPGACQIKQEENGTFEVWLVENHTHLKGLTEDQVEPALQDLQVPNIWR